MSTTDHVLALDSGGSKTVSLLARADGTVVAAARGRGAAATTDVPGAALEALTPVLTEVLRALPPDGRLVGVYACLGGLNTAAVSAAIRSLSATAAVEVVRESSGDVVYTGAPYWGFDIAIMAGTGSIALGVNRLGQRRVTGGWGPLVHDRGSGYDVGRLALQAVAEALDYRGQATLLLPAIGRKPPFAENLPQDGTLSRAPADLTYEQRLAIKEAIKRAYPRLDRGTVAGLFPVVADCARHGDILAGGILQDAAAALAAMVCALASELQLSQPRIVALGGVFASREPMLRLFTEAVQRICPGAAVTRSDFSLIRGAVIVALRHAGLPVDAAVVERVRLTAARLGA
jgi:N-acetylglucosamine kinase-like BadF-type ATPase